MEFIKQQADALDCLYGSGAPAMCAVTHDIRLLWNNRCFEQRFLLLVQAKAAAKQDILQSCVDIPLTDGSEYIYCTVEKMHIGADAPDDAAPDFYLLRFRAEPVLSLAHDAGTEMLISCAGECRNAAEQSLHALDEIYRMLQQRPCGDTEQQAIDRMLASCYRFLDQAVRFEELSWYGDADMHRTVEDTPIALTVKARALFDSIRRMTGTLLPVTFTADDEPLWVKVNEERLLFVLLSLFQMVFGSCKAGCAITVHCGREGDAAVISMRAESTDAQPDGQVHAIAYSFLNDTPLSNEALMRRFCKQYNAEITRKANAVYQLRIPLADQQNIAFESPAYVQEEGRFGTIGTMLSAMVDFHHTGDI